MRAKEKKEINVLIGEQIRLYRDKSGMSRERLAELMGVTPRFVADVELGFVGVSLTSLKKICEILGISAAGVSGKKKTPLFHCRKGYPMWMNNGFL